jgi:hypothetical protein
VFLGPLDGNVQALADALVDDAAFRAAMGGIVFVRTSENVGAVLAAFPELHDAALLVAQLRASGAFRIVVLNGPAGCLGIPPPDQLGTAVEYYNASLDHYFLTADAGEKSILDKGSIAGWSRTGEQFTVVLQPGCIETSGMHRVYRFYRKPIAGIDTHFFTVSETECAVLRDKPTRDWQFEAAPFWVKSPVVNACPAATVPVFRIYNNGQGGAPNHRYATQRPVVDAMVRDGWIEEGVSMCADARAPP